MAVPRFYVVARVVGSPQSFKQWVERLIPLCDVSATEPLGITYYWGQDLDGEPDTLWGLEGYSHAVGFFMGHPSSDIFKREMAIVDKTKLLKHEQGLSSCDYDLHHYDLVGGWLTRVDDPEKNSKTSHVAVHHFFAADKRRQEVIELLCRLAGDIEALQGIEGIVQSWGVLKECNDQSLVTLWLRTKTEKDFKMFQKSGLYRKAMEDLASGGLLVVKIELHNSRAFIGHIDKVKQC